MKVADLFENVISLDAARKNKEKLTATIELTDIPEKKLKELFKDVDGGKFANVAMHEQGVFTKNGVKVAYMEVGVYPFNRHREIWIVYRDPKNPDELISEPVPDRN